MYSFFRRPKAPAFLFLSPLESTWENLQSVIPNMLQMSVVGYPFVNPGAVGGFGKFINQQEGNIDEANITSTREDWELYIRWYQLNTFMPMLHFLKPPKALPKNVVCVIFLLCMLLLIITFLLDQSYCFQT